MMDIIESGIEKLKRILEGHPEQPFSTEEYMRLYSTIYDMCTQKPPPDYSEQLYKKYKEAITEYISSTVLPSLSEKHDEFLLRELVKRWENHKLMVRCLSQLFHYLDRHFTVRRLLPGLKELCQKLKVKVIDAVTTLIDQKQKGEEIDINLLREVLYIYVKIWKERKDSAPFFGFHISPLLIDMTTKESYSVPMLKDLEEERVYYESPKFNVEKAQSELLEEYRSQLFENEHSGYRRLLRDDKVDDLSKMFRLLIMMPNNAVKSALERKGAPMSDQFKQHIQSTLKNLAKDLMPVINIFNEHVTENVMALVQQAENAESNRNAAGGVQEQVFVRKVIELHDKYMGYVTECFLNNSDFGQALKEAFEIFCNKVVAGVSSAELLASFCDNILKKGGSEDLSDEAIEDTLDKVVKLLAYISGRDLFAEHCRKKLSRRLLHNKSASYDRERLLLSKLKQKFGEQLTSKMEGMVVDLVLSRETRGEFGDHISANRVANPGMDLAVTIINQRYWPSYKYSDLSLPAEMVKCVEVFNEFYGATKFKKLKWLYSLGTCHVNGNFEQKTIELILGTYQAAALLLFNASDRLSFSEIRRQLNLDEKDVARVLQSLSCANYKILNKEPSSKTVSQTDYFSFNSKFTNSTRRIRIGQPRLPTVDERKEVVEYVDKDRRYAIEAKIVSIMKSKKELDFEQLVSICVDQLSYKFKPDIKVIKQRIEALIDRGFLERDQFSKLKYLP